MPNHHIHENTGWFQITNTMLIIMIGVVGISVDIPTGIKVTYHNTIKKIKNRYDRYQNEKLMIYIEEIILKYPDEFKEEERQVQLYKNLLFCNDWLPQRVWLLNNK